MNPEVLTAKKWYRWLWLSPLITIPTIFFIFFNLREALTRLICGQPWCGSAWESDLADWWSFAAILGSALWHLILLVPARNRQSEFVRWHGRQALLLAGVRTAIPLAFLVAYVVASLDLLSVLLSILVLVPVWFFGTWWGQREAGRGECTLMRLTGHGAGLLLSTTTAKPTAAPVPAPLSRERWQDRSTYDRGLVQRAQGKPAKAARLFCELLVSDCTLELKAKAARELNQMSGIDENITPDVLVAIFRFSRDREQQHMALSRLKLLGMVEAL